MKARYVTKLGLLRKKPKTVNLQREYSERKLVFKMPKLTQTYVKRQMKRKKRVFYTMLAESD